MVYLSSLFIVLHVSHESLWCTNMVRGSTSANKLALHRHSKMVVSKLERNNRKGPQWVALLWLQPVSTGWVTY